ncbi:receptor-like kinase [Medicago truncatula]|uniref:Receptor-like kinase n=1 Tax=Medicago truncatula TaxID=3880 RepID=G7K1A0_MEDTR|nr:receptor-like kinase [Medicago truncatula]
MVLLILAIYLSRKINKKSSPESPTVDQLDMVSYQALYQATNGFSARNLIGLGDKVIAIKVLNFEKKGAHKSFITECNELKNIRHRNLVKILTCFSSIDYKGQEFKALVFEYMQNGKLRTMVESKDRECRQLILHCDIKPSNILVDEDIVSQASDFGIARLVSSVSPPRKLYGMDSKVSTYGDMYSFGIPILEMLTRRRPID